MDNLAEVLELIHGAGESFHTVRASLRVWRDEERQLLAFERHHEEERGRGGAAAVVMFADSAASTGEDDVEGEASEQIRLWLEKPSRLREEVAGRFPRTTVTDGETTWSYSPEMGALEHEHDGDAGSGEAGLLFDPARLLPGLDLEPVERIQFCGRDAIRIRAKPRRELSEAIFRLGPGADVGSSWCQAVITDRRRPSDAHRHVESFRERLRQVLEDVEDASPRRKPRTPAAV
jgi:hypothetical protein